MMHSTLLPPAAAAAPTRLPVRVDIRDVLELDHQQALSTMCMLIDAEDPLEARDYFQVLRTGLVVHARAEEAVVHTALEGLGADQAVMAAHTGNVEHALWDHLIVKLAHSRPTSALWKARAAVVRNLLEHHIDAERRTLYGLLGTLFDADQRMAMAQAYTARKRRLLRRL